MNKTDVLTAMADMFVAFLKPCDYLYCYQMDVPRCVYNIPMIKSNLNCIV